MFFSQNNNNEFEKYFASGIAPLQLSDVFVLGAHTEMMKCCRISVVRALSEVEAMERTELRMEIRPKLRPN